ncbi:hypothetical protein [Nostoc sp. CMAA1605]|uniref:hypothetical protein n=1 Tax=Nostoc sp. CMAA1605 TaxID=2055159 RepID=UPI001F45EBE8|nr:hypothetical protein [Nostoc sp. CMAA1605]
MGIGDWGLGTGDKVDKVEFISQPTTDYSLLITHYSPLSTHHSPLVENLSPD